MALHIDGEWISGGGRRTEPVIDPATEEVLAEVPHATPGDLDHALAAAESGFRASPPAAAGRRAPPTPSYWWGS
ncbi:MAG: aldehyde dehydrogenase family protein [Streptosporangiales bacterium]|nr:aldehyde dehydrogenase family protein [Streptosporangiales bacterium]